MGKKSFAKGLPLPAWILGVFLWPALVWAQSSSGTEPPYFAIRDARIVQVSGPVIENGTVVIAHGLIQAVGADVTIPPEAWVIEGRGLTVYPGLIDAGTDLGLPQPPAAPQPPGGPPSQKVAMGPEDRPATTPWKDAADELKPDDKRIEMWREAGFTTALTSPRGGIFPGQGTIIDLAGDRASEMVVKAPATLDLSFQPVGGFRSFPDSLMGVIAYVRQVFLDTNWYMTAEPIYEANVSGLERPPYDRTERVLARVLRSRELVLVPANNEVQIRRALRLVQEWGVHAALVGGQQGYAVAEEIAANKIPVIVSLKWPERPKDADPEAEAPLRVLRFRGRAPSTPAALGKAGVKFAFASGGLGSPKEIQKSLKKALDAGLGEDAALRALTLDAAEIVGLSGRLGSIERGKIANLVVTDGDIFNEKTKVKDVFVDGRWFPIREAPRPEKPAEKKTLHAARDAADGQEGGAR